MYTCINCGHNWSTKYFLVWFRVSVASMTTYTDRNVRKVTQVKRYETKDRWFRIDDDLIKRLEEGTYYICTDESSCAQRVFMNQFEERTNE